MSHPASHLTSNSVFGDMHLQTGFGPVSVVNATTSAEAQLELGVTAPLGSSTPSVQP